MKTIPQIVEMTANAFGLLPATLLGKDRRKSVVLARSIAMWVARNHGSWTYAEIGEAFDRDQATTVHWIRAAGGNACCDPALKRTMEKLLAEANGEEVPVAARPCHFCGGDLVTPKQERYCRRACQRAASKARQSHRQTLAAEKAKATAPTPDPLPLRTCPHCKKRHDRRHKGNGRPLHYCSITCSKKHKRHGTGAYVYQVPARGIQCGQCAGIPERRPEDGSRCACGEVWAERGFYDRPGAIRGMSMLATAERWGG